MNQPECGTPAAAYLFRSQRLRAGEFVLIYRRIPALAEAETGIGVAEANE
ncbi:MAG: hypothetical protein AAF581_17205 [Planctomycetota bacterium]